MNFHQSIPYTAIPLYRYRFPPNYPLYRYLSVVISLLHHRGSCIDVTGYHDILIPVQELIKYFVEFEFAAKWNSPLTRSD